MKKIALIVLMQGIVLASGHLFAQSDEVKITTSTKATQGTYLDLVLNAVSTNFNYGSQNRSVSDYKRSTLGAQIGASFRAGITSDFSIVTELYFIMKGGSLRSNNPLTMDKSTLRLYTLELPVLARIHFGKFHVNAGPSVAYNFYGTRQIEESSSSVVFNNSSNGIKRWDAGVQFGAGYKFHTKRKAILLDVRYNYGLTNIAYTGQMYNRSLIIALHFTKPWKTNPFAKNR